MCTGIRPRWYLLSMSVDGSQGGKPVVMRTCSLLLRVATAMRLSFGIHATAPCGVLTTSCPGFPVAVELALFDHCVYAYSPLT